MGKGGESHPQININDTIITKDNSNELHIMGRIPILLRLFHQLMSHKILYNVETYVKTFLVMLLTLKGNFYVCLFEDEEPASFHEVSSSPPVDEWIACMTDKIDSIE